MITISTSIEIICFLVSLLSLKYERNKSWLSLRLYLMVVCIVEFIGLYLKSQHHANQWPYNVLLPVQIVFTCFFFGDLFSCYLKSKPSIIPIIGGFALLSLLLIYSLFTQSFLIFYESAYNTMAVVFVIYSLCFFYLLQKDDRYIDLKISPQFWWVFGVLAFYFGSTAVNIFRGRLHIMINSKHYLTYYINIVLNIILYGCWSYSFICRRWLTTTSKG